MVTILDVADFFLASQDEDAGDTISNLKLQKLCYYAQGFTLAITGVPLFNDEIQAWAHGPVIPNLYRHFREYKSSAIPKPTRDLAAIRSLFSSEQLEVLDDVNEVYGQFSAWKLRDMTHQEKPWQDAWDGTQYSVGTISQESMRSYFKTRLAS